MKKFLPYLPLFLVFCVTAALFIKVNQSGKDAVSYEFGFSPMVGKNLPEFQLPILGSDKLLSQQNFSGKYTVLNLFASWCLACLHEHPLFKDLDKNKFQIIGVAWRDKPEDSFAWLEKHGNPYNIVALDELGKFGISVGVTGIPETFIINPQGEIIRHYRGAITIDDANDFESILK